MEVTNVVPPKTGGKTVEKEYGSKFDNYNFLCQTDVDVQVEWSIKLHLYFKITLKTNMT